ncbi:MAG: peptidoglycan-binding domain-containing protein [Eubacteriales bacterium]|nr:peptidoglycan-binding domain-containing protein [Eubacteriales bacterium]
MKKLLAVVLVLALLAPSIAMAVELTPMSDEQILKLHESILTEMRNRGIYPYVSLKSGSSGDEVANLQRRLATLGYYTKDATGKFDGATAAALKAFEKAAGLKQDGAASVDDQEALYNAKAPVKPTPTPKPTPRPTPTKKPTPTPDPRKAYGRFDYTSVARTPDSYRGDMVKISGYVVQVLGDARNGFELRVATKGRYDNILYIFTAGNHNANILEKDRINFYCRLAGTITYTTVMGASITIPAAYCDFYQYIQ